MKVAKTKVCTKCSKRKKISVFRVRKSRGREILVSYCVQCERDEQREYRKSHLKERAAYLRRLRQEKPEIFKAHDLKKYEKHGEKIRARNRKRSKENYWSDPAASREKARELRRNFYQKNPSSSNSCTKRQIEKLSRGYVASKIGMPSHEVPEGLIEAKRIQIQIKRYLKEHNL